MFGRVRHRADVRAGLCVLFILLGASGVAAQEQERKLVDRLLRPDMTLANDAQSKQFTGAREATGKPAHVKSFAARSNSHTKAFSGQLSFFSRMFRTGRGQQVAPAANLSTRTDLSASVRELNPEQSSLPREENQARKVASAGDYAGARPFVARGKSQKALSAQNTPLTIDEVRELLNRNK